MDRATTVATTLLELVGMSLLGLALGVAVRQHWGLPAGILAAGLAYLTFSWIITTIRTPQPAARVESGPDA